MAKSVKARNRTSRTKGRQGEFAVREMLARYFKVHPDDVLLRSKSANGCDIIFTHRELHTFPFSVEVKNRKSIPYFQVVEQMITNTEEDTMPLSIILNEKLGHTCIVPSDVFLAMVALLNKHVEEWGKLVLGVKDEVNICTPKIRDSRAVFKIGD